MVEQIMEPLSDQVIESPSEISQSEEHECMNQLNSEQEQSME